MKTPDEVKAFFKERQITAELFGKSFEFIIERDLKDPINGRVFLQISYTAPCTKTGEDQPWKGRKYYLSEHMTPDEVVKTAYVAFQQAVTHEVMEGFKVDNKVLFNPHVHFEELLKVSDKEIRRE